ncbi:MAG: hypothetical protein WC637_10695 [Victivallales bacterium]|jgi:hypothetical protein
MKNTRQVEEFQELLKSGKLVSGGFLGEDRRNFLEIIDADKAELFKLKISAGELAGKMRQITGKAVEGLGTWVQIDSNTEAKADEARGSLPCPWPHHPGVFAKRVTTVRRIDTGQELRWSDLSIHLIGEHSFFEGKGSSYRIEPRKLAEIIFR